MISSLLSRALLDPKLAHALASAPEDAIRSAEHEISSDDLQFLSSIDSALLARAAERLEHLLKPDSPNRSPSTRTLKDFVYLVSQQKGATNMLEDLVALLDQQQQQKGRQFLQGLAAILDQQQQQGGRNLQDLAALLDQQQQQKGRQLLQDLAAVLDQQQQQGGRNLQDLAALLDQQQQQKGRQFLQGLAAILDQQQQQGSKQLANLKGESQ
ncbi:TPA: hypothetical protein N0H34_003799 [Pseudomonas aeruginosa]|nr:hypothetical protein [Pseudomonas aeruginosa]HBO5146927.1 hypothetical protein [Pseudomonas aeruginosa]HCK4739254.1 hypothetical protein [Pseudomonas aeruginosa]